MSRECGFQQCGILTSVDSGEPVQPPFKLRNSKRCSVSSLTDIAGIFKRVAKALIRLSICAGWSEPLRVAMRGSRKFCQRGSNFDNIFLVDKGREDPSTTISGLSLCGSSCRDPESFVREGQNMTTFFFYDKGREDPSTTISGRFGGVPMMALYWMLAW